MPVPTRAELARAIDFLDISNEVGLVKSVFISFAHTPAALPRLFLGE
jgi:hypothetical protein